MQQAYFRLIILAYEMTTMRSARSQANGVEKTTPRYPTNIARRTDAEHLAISSAMQAANGALEFPSDCTAVL